MLMARVLRIVAVLSLLVASVFFGAGAANAGGPTSALLVSPGYQQAAAVYYSDPEYDQLSTLLGGYEPVADRAAPASAGSPDVMGGNYVTVTWLIHDVSIWRIDRIILASDEEPWIVTEMFDGSVDSASGMGPGGSGNDNAIRHRSPDPAALTTLLAGLGLLGSTPTVVDGIVAAAGQQAAVGQQAGADQQPIAAPVQANVVDSTARAAAPWWWMLAGLAVGALLTAVLIRFVPGIREKVLERPTDDTRRMVEQPS